MWSREVDRGWERRSDGSRIGQGHRAQSVLRVLHGAGSVREDGGKHHGGGGVSGTHFRQRYDSSEGGGTASAGSGLGARGADRFGHHRLVEANSGIRRSDGAAGIVRGQRGDVVYAP